MALRAGSGAFCQSSWFSNRLLEKIETIVEQVTDLLQGAVARAAPNKWARGDNCPSLIFSNTFFSVLRLWMAYCHFELNHNDRINMKSLKYQRFWWNWIQEGCLVWTPRAELVVYRRVPLEKSGNKAVDVKLGNTSWLKKDSNIFSKRLKCILSLV